MRLVGVLATCFVLLAALIYGFQHREEIVLQLADRVEAMMPAEVAVVDAHDLPVAATATEVIMPMREAGRMNAFTGFPGYTKATFALPRRSAPQSGVLMLDLNGELGIGAQGILRVTVNGVRRTELVLDEGRLRRRVMVPLNARDLARQTVVVALASEGRAPQAECSGDWNGGIVVQIMPTSHVQLVLDAPLTDPSDLLLTNTAPLRLEWPMDDSALQARTLKAAHLFSVGQNNILLVPQGKGGLTVNRPILDALEIQAAARPPIQNDPLDLVETLGRKRSVAFEGEASWRVSFDRRTLEKGAAAAGLDLNMTYDAAGDDSGWLLSVRLNDRLIHSEELIDASGTVARQLMLPTADQPMLNDLRVTLTSAEHRPGRCAAARPATADVNFARLTLVAPEQESVWADVQGILSGELHLAAHPQLEANSGQLALDMLNALLGGTALPLQADRTDPAALPAITAVSLVDLPEVVTQVNEARSWIVTLGEEYDSALTIVRVADVDAVFYATAPHAVLLIEEKPHYSSAHSGQ